jgi:hypothetical protein
MIASPSVRKRAERLRLCHHLFYQKPRLWYQKTSQLLEQDAPAEPEFPASLARVERKWLQQLQDAELEWPVEGVVEFHLVLLWLVLVVVAALCLHVDESWRHLVVQFVGRVQVPHLKAAAQRLLR